MEQRSGRGLLRPRGLGRDVGQGKSYAVPLFHATTSLFYRKDLFKEAGVDPASIKTWDDLVEAARKLTRDIDKDGRVDIWGFGTPLSTERTGGTTAFTTMLVGGGKVWETASRTMRTMQVCVRCNGMST